MVDDGGAKGARQHIAMIKAVAPSMAQRVVDTCVQIHGAPLTLRHATPRHASRRCRWRVCVRSRTRAPAAGGAGLSDDTPLAHFYMWARALRLADGPDEVHLASVAKAELKSKR